MQRRLLPLALVAAAFMAQSPAAKAQTDIAVPGGATGSNVACIQAGELSSGAFVGTFLETSPQVWEERLKAGTFKLQEKKRGDLMVDLSDDTRAASIQFDFVNKTIKYKSASSKDPSGKDRYYILNATDKAHSEDCASLAANNPAGGSGPGGGAGGPGSSPRVMTQVPPKMLIVIPPGTQFTATAGPPCPGNPGMFLCPNRFSCVPLGGVCCPGVGGCPAGQFCDRFVLGACIGSGNPRFCAGTDNLGDGTGMHCDVGLTCIGNNRCR
jgi:hypothetical protein